MFKNDNENNKIQSVSREKGVLLQFRDMVIDVHHETKINGMPFGIEFARIEALKGNIKLLYAVHEKLNNGIFFFFKIEIARLKH
jgi:hypothetical protein